MKRKYFLTRLGMMNKISYIIIFPCKSFFSCAAQTKKILHQPSTLVFCGYHLPKGATVLDNPLVLRIFKMNWAKFEQNEAKIRFTEGKRKCIDETLRKYRLFFCLWLAYASNLTFVVMMIISFLLKIFLRKSCIVSCILLGNRFLKNLKLCNSCFSVGILN